MLLILQFNCKMCVYNIPSDLQSMIDLTLGEILSQCLSCIWVTPLLLHLMCVSCCHGTGGWEALKSWWHHCSCCCRHSSGRSYWESATVEGNLHTTWNVAARVGVGLF